MTRVLYAKETVLDKENLKKHLAKFAICNIVKAKSDKNTYPIPRLKENCKYISLIYTLLNEHVKIGIPIHPAGEWILDNYYMIEKSVKTIQKELTKTKYINLPGVEESQTESIGINRYQNHYNQGIGGFARIYVLANEIISNTDGKVDGEELKEYLESYQTQKNLTMEEIWMIGTFLQIAIIEKIRNICERIFISQTQKFKVENMIERIIENKPKKNLKMTASGAYPFIEYMSYRLKRYGKDGMPYLMAFEEQVNKMGMTISEVISREHFDIAVRKLSMKNSITSIRNISRLNISSIFKEINEVEKILNEDPAEVYPKMDYISKDYYRNKILEISKKAKISEIFVAKEAIRLCNEAIEEKSKDYNEKQSHVGYYLIDDGYNKLISKIMNNNSQNKQISIRKLQKRNKENINKSDANAKLYVASIYFFTILITSILFIYIKINAILLFIPIQNAVTQIIRHLILEKIKRRHIPKIELEEGIPESLATMCVIPVTLKTEKDVKEIFEKMEVYYLANKSENLYFTLLGDCTNSTSEVQKEDKKIVEEGIKQSKYLNEKYGEKFFFTYRKREWSEGERCFMGWERKRGMINQFNEFLITGVSKFKENTCNLKNIPKIKYVITIDSDTNLIMDSAKKLVGAMSHILNKPEVDKIKNIVTKGYGIIQPRVSIDIEESRKSLFTRVFSEGSGIDIYSRSIIRHLSRLIRRRNIHWKRNI